MVKRTGRSVHLEISEPGIDERGPAKALYIERFHHYYVQLHPFKAKGKPSFSILPALKDRWQRLGSGSVTESELE